MRSVMILFLAVLYSCASVGTTHAAAKKPFIATTVQTIPGVGEQRGKIFVSPRGMRFEFSENGREVVQIVAPEDRLMRILFPADKVYMEVRAPDNAPLAKPDDVSPCPPNSNMTCEKLGVDKFGEMDVERWRQTLKGVSGSAIAWWEPTRKMIVRQEYPDGRIKQLKLVGEEDFYGRKAERWDISYASPNRPVMQGHRLVDIALGVIVKEQDHRGMIRELRDVKVVDDDSAWFLVPGGFTLVDAPKPGAPRQQR